MSEQNKLPVTWKLGDRWAPFHPQASHVPPDYRDGWNAAYSAATARIASLEAKLNEQAMQYLALDTQHQQALGQLEEARKAAQTCRHRRLGEALEKAASALPDGYEITVYVERGSGSVGLTDPGVRVIEVPEDSERDLAREVLSAIDSAIKAADGGGK